MSTTASTRVLVVDDDPLVRSGLGLILGGAPDLEVIAHAGDGREALDLVDRLAPDVVLMDIRMPELDGLAATEAIFSADRADARPQVIVLTTFGADEYVVRALAAGAGGFLLKDTPPEQIVEAIRTVARGEPMLSPQALASLIRQVTEQAGGGEQARVAGARTRLARLTDREREVALAVGEGLSNADIAGRLYLSVATVKAHIGRLFTKLDVDNRVQIAICVHDARLDD